MEIGNYFFEWAINHGCQPSLHEKGFCDEIVGARRKIVVDITEFFAAAPTDLRIITNFDNLLQCETGRKGRGDTVFDGQAGKAGNPAEIHQNIDE